MFSSDPHIYEHIRAIYNTYGIETSIEEDYGVVQVWMELNDSIHQLRTSMVIDPLIVRDSETFIKELHRLAGDLLTEAANGARSKIVDVKNYAEGGERIGLYSENMSRLRIGSGSG